MANLTMVKWRTKKMGLLLFLLIQESIFAKCEVVRMEVQTESPLNELDNPTESYLNELEYHNETALDESDDPTESYLNKLEYHNETALDESDDSTESYLKEFEYQNERALNESDDLSKAEYHNETALDESDDSTESYLNKLEYHNETSMDESDDSTESYLNELEYHNETALDKSDDTTELYLNELVILNETALDESDDPNESYSKELEYHNEIGIDKLDDLPESYLNELEYHNETASDESDDPTGSVLDELDTGLLSVSDVCSDYGIDNLPHPRIILLGPTGAGKSTLANQLLGRNPLNESERLFSVGDGVESHTIEITYVVGNWLGDGPCFTIIDTPGASDGEGRDYQHALAMANIMKDQIKSVDIFLLCFNGGVPRFDQSTIDLLKLYESIFSKEMWNHAVTEVTHWSHDRRSVKNRQRRKNTDEKIRHKQWNSQYKEELDVTVDIPSVYIDPVLLIFDAEEEEFLEEREKEAFKKYTDELFKYGNTSEPFFCDGNCMAPNGYFLGNPWIETKNITARQGEKAVIKCQIWNGMQGKASDNVTWTKNGEVIYEKTTSKNPAETSINSTDVWGSNIKFVEMLSPGEGHFTDFIIEFESLEETMEGKYTCDNGRITEENWAKLFMRVDGTWGEWGAWGKCSISCLSNYGQMGSKKRVREAVAPRNGGNPVNPLDAEDTQICAGERGPDNPIQCPIDFSWNSWTKWSRCSQECGDGITLRVRSCNQGSYGGAMCPSSVANNLSEREEKKCKIKNCPKCILVSEWQEWSQCSKTCMSKDTGTKKRQRTTKEADPDKPQCNPDDHSQEKLCNTIPCPKDFSWNSWTEWSNCSQECGDGVTLRVRSCNQGSHGGKMCPLAVENNLSEREEKFCKIKDCPKCILVSEWQEWSQCSKTCMSKIPGTKKRQRTTKEADPGKPQCNPDDHSQEKACNTKPCPKDFSWNSWTEWSECSPRCGNGNTYRVRSCNQGSNGGKICPLPVESNLSKKEEKACKIKDCPNCILLGWQVWSQCSKTCMGHQVGSRIRQRSTKEADPNNPLCNADDHSEQEICNTFPCPVDGGWTPWTRYGPCSATCGSPSPTQIRTRSCTEPAAQYGGKYCTGLREELRNCNTKPCPVDGEWAPWSSWTGCSATCGSPSPTQSRTRSCSEPTPQYGGKRCPGWDTDSRSCNAIRCPVDGGWTAWSIYGPCSATCGSPTKIKTRSCTAPAPQYGGEHCSGPREESESCNKVACPVDGRWASWSSWSSCSATCGSLSPTQSRTRNCTEPQHGGEGCSGKSFEQKTCNEKQCPVDGGWTDWSIYGPCSATCGPATKIKTRSCTAPPPLYGGERCSGPREESESCNNVPCPVDGRWASWSSWTGCSATCGSLSNTQSRTRNCNEPQHGGEGCPGVSHEQKTCNEKQCPVDGGWTPWTSYGPCSATCGSPSPTKMRTRSCTEPAAQYGGNPCTGDREELKNCNSIPCPEDGRWAPWSSWTGCSATCGSLSPTQSRTRNCNEPQHGGEDCPGNSFEQKTCNEKQCPVDGGWTPWTSYGPCSATCGSPSPTQIRTRSCTEPVAQYGGNPCTGDREEPKDCNTIPCPVDGKWEAWSSWSPCSSTCGSLPSPTRERTRVCAEPKHSGEHCPGASHENKPCYQEECPGCFPGASLVMLEGGEKKRMNELRIGDVVLTVDNAKLVSTTVLGFLDKRINQTTEYLNLNIEDGTNLFISPTHAIFIKGDDNSIKSVLAKEVNPGDMVVTEEGFSRVKQVTAVLKNGAYVPLTDVGTLIVDGVLVSCYTNANHWVAHIFLAPLRWWPATLLDTEESQHIEGVKTYPWIIKNLGYFLGLAEVSKPKDKTESKDFPVLEVPTPRLTKNMIDKDEL